MTDKAKPKGLGARDIEWGNGMTKYHFSWSGWMVRPQFFFRLDAGTLHIRDFGPVRVIWSDITN